MEFFEKAFNWLANISARLPKIDFKTYFIVVVAVIVGIGVIIALTYFGSRARKLINASKKIEKYLANVDQIDDDNVSDFTAHCFSSKAPQSLRDSWVQYLGVRFGYPSDIVSDKNVYEKIVKKNKDYRSGIYLAIALIVLGVFAFWGYGTIEAIAMSVVHFVGLVAIGVTYLVLIIINRKQSKRCLEVFEDMQEDLDAKVNLQVESNYATDSSPLAELSGLVEEIIARNTAKAVDEEQEYALEQTPIEALIEETEDEESSDEDGEEAQSDEGIEDQEDGAVEQTIDELIASEPQDADEEPAKVAEQTDEQTEEVAYEEPVEDTDETVEEEPVQDEEAEEVEEVQEPVVDEQEPIEDEQSAKENEGIESEETEEEQEPETEDVEESVEEPAAQEQVESEEPIEQAEEPQENIADEQESEDAQPDEDEQAVESDEQDTQEEPQEAEDDQDGESGEDESEQAQSDESVEEEQTDEKGDEEPEVVYVVEGDEEDEETVKPAKLVKLPNLVDYMLTKNMPKSMKIQIASMLIATYNKFKDSKEDRKIVVSCLGKVMSDLQSTK